MYQTRVVHLLLIWRNIKLQLWIFEHHFCLLDKHTTQCFEWVYDGVERDKNKKLLVRRQIGLLIFTNAYLPARTHKKYRVVLKNITRRFAVITNCLLRLLIFFFFFMVLNSSTSIVFKLNNKLDGIICKSVSPFPRLLLIFFQSIVSKLYSNWREEKIYMKKSIDFVKKTYFLAFIARDYHGINSDHWTQSVLCTRMCKQLLSRILFFICNQLTKVPTSW